MTAPSRLSRLELIERVVEQGSSEDVREVLRWCWRKLYPDAMKLDAIAKELGVSRERVRQVEAKALRKLRGALGRNPELAEAMREWIGERVTSGGGYGMPGTERRHTP